MEYKTLYRQLLKQVFSKHIAKKILPGESHFFDQTDEGSEPSSHTSPIELRTFGSRINNCSTENLNIVAVGRSIVIQQNPICRNVLISKKESPIHVNDKWSFMLNNIQSKTYFLAMPYVIYVITLEQPGCINILFSNEPITKLNQLVKFPYLFNVSDESFICLGDTNWTKHSSLNDIINNIWDSFFTYPTGVTFYKYLKLFSYDEWEQRTLKNQKEAINWILNQDLIDVNKYMLIPSTPDMLSPDQLPEKFEPATLEDIMNRAAKAADWFVRMHANVELNETMRRIAASLKPMAPE